MSEKSRAIVLTGVGRHSLGESIVRRFLASMPNARIIGIDREPSPDLLRTERFTAISMDINPISEGTHYATLQGRLQSEINEALDRISCSEIAWLVQSAGIYGAGHVLDHDTETRISILGVNLIARIETLVAVLKVNHARESSSSHNLGYCDIGSTHGLAVLPGRPLYSLSKAGGLELCISLHKSAEVARCIHLAPGPIDTHMLHRNHWVIKAGGPTDFFEAVLAGPESRYNGIFIECNDEVLRHCASEMSHDPSGLLAYFQQYKRYRETAAAGEYGILSSEECAEMIYRIVAEPATFEDGVYIATAPRNSQRLRGCGFDELSRADLFERLSRECL